MEEEIQAFAGWLGSLEVLPTLTALRARGDEVVAQVLAENEGRWEALTERDRQRVEALAHAIAKRLLHEPTRTSRASTPTTATRASRSCASCSGSTTERRRRRGGGAARRGPRGFAPAVTTAAAADRDARQRLALAQARAVAALLPAPSELVTITTAGDVGRGAGDKSRWVGALEAALRAGEIDLAVHSAKDVPGELAPGTAIVAAPRRADPLDVLVGERRLADVREGARVGTSALRRRAQLLAARPDLEVVELRGNVDTRLRKLAAGEVDVLVLAAAGLDRLDRRREAGGALFGDVFVPAAGAGRDRRPGPRGQRCRRGRRRREPCPHPGMPAGRTGRRA